MAEDGSFQKLREGLLFGMGNPLLDISAVVDDEFLQKYGLNPNDAILADEKHIPMYDEMVEKYEVEYIAGGATLNSMKVAQWILGKPNVATFMGCIGKDKYGKILEEKAREAGVNTHFQYHDTVPTGTCAVLITDNGRNRSLCANLSAANNYDKKHLDEPANENLMQKADFFYISGFFLTVSPESMLKVAKHACETKKVFCMNLSAPFLSQFFKEPMMKVFPYVDIIFGNETEAATFSKEQNLGTSDVKEIALKLSSLPKENSHRKRIAVITQGSENVVVALNDEIREFPVTHLVDSKIVDTNGAGDAFVGGFLAQFIQGKAISTCVKCGVYAATVVIQHSGCVFPKTHHFQE